MIINCEVNTVTLINLCCLVVGVLSYVYQCNDPYECSDERIKLNDTNAQIDCWSYEACLNAMALVVNGGLSQTVHCGGSYSCYGADVIVAGGKYTLNGNTGNIMCEGYHSCSQANLFAQDAIFCQGSFSCVNSVLSYDFLNYWKYNNLQIQNSQNSQMWNSTRVAIYCDASYSCAGAELYQVRSVMASGRHSLWWATIWSGGVTLNVTLSGYEAGYNLNIFCSNKSGFVSDYDVCKLTCQANGCHETYLHCDGLTSDKCTYDCGYDSICPYVCYNGICDRDNWIYGVGHVDSVQTIDWYEAKWLSDKSRQAQVLDDFSDDNFNLYCEDGNHSTLCDSMGWHGVCFASNHTIRNEKNSVCCRGYLSCAYSQRIDTSSASISDGSKDASQSSHILCDGSASCEKTSLTNSNVNGYIYCGGSQSCSRTTISGQMYAGTRLNCDGFLSCFESNIFNLSWLQCTALDSCFSATITDVAYIDASAANSLVRARIWTVGIKNTTIISLNADSAAVGAQIYVSKNSNLTLECQSALACSGVKVQCNGTCEIKCFENEGFSCPSVTFYHGDSQTIGLSTSTDSTTSTIIGTSTSLDTNDAPDDDSDAYDSDDTSDVDSVDSSGNKASSGINTWTKWTLIAVGAVLACGCIVVVLLLIARRRKQEQQLKDMQMQSSMNPMDIVGQSGPINQKAMDRVKVPFEKLTSSSD